MHEPKECISREVPSAGLQNKQPAVTDIAPHFVILVLYQEATGVVSIRMPNDHLFPALMQMHQKVLKSLAGALLHLELIEIVSAEITYPIELGHT